MRYDPRAGLLPDGEYDATIIAAEDKVSSNGNPMIEMVLRVYTSAEPVEIKDWAMQAMPWKLRHLSRAVGHDFDSGDLAPGDVLEQNVRVRVSTQKSDQYGEQNKIADYLSSANGKPGADKDIPF